jgi:hypothetical protein
MKKEGSMRKEYDMSKGERGKLFGKVDTSRVTVEYDDLSIDEAIDGELSVLESNLDRIELLRARLPELDPKLRQSLAKRLAEAKAKLEEMAIPE